MCNSSCVGKHTRFLMFIVSGLTNEQLREKFVLITDGTNGSGLTYRCTKCPNVFNANEKVMEKHYFANHEFR